MYVSLDKIVLFHQDESFTLSDMEDKVSNRLNLPKEDIYLEQNGRKLNVGVEIDSTKDVKVILRLKGGKGGFGSMLRAIGAQIEKTTNREACRDLSGRRLRDINEEQRLKNWLASKAEREKEAAAKRKRKLEKMCEEPKHEFKDDAYFKELSELPKRVEDAVLQGLEASTSLKRPAENENKPQKKRKLWVDDDMEELSSSDDEGSESEEKDATTIKSTDEEVTEEKNCEAKAIAV